MLTSTVTGPTASPKSTVVFIVSPALLVVISLCIIISQGSMTFTAGSDVSVDVKTYSSESSSKAPICCLFIFSFRLSLKNDLNPILETSSISISLTDDPANLITAPLFVSAKK